MQVVIHNATIILGSQNANSVDALLKFLADAELHHADAPAGAPAIPTPEAAPAAAAPVSNVIRNAADVTEGTPIHWSGVKFTFDGVVANGRRVRYPDDDAVLYVRRNDTGKLVSLTQDDLNRGGLTRRNG